VKLRVTGRGRVGADGMVIICRNQDENHLFIHFVLGYLVNRTAGC